VDIDAYDYRNQERMELLRGKVDDAPIETDCKPAGEIGTPTPGHASHTHSAQGPVAPSPGSEEGRQFRRWKI